MITRLRLKNWRSLRDVTIDDLQPINVFIGANASGKTNILDALYFVRDMMSEDIMRAVYQRDSGNKIRTLGAIVEDIVEIEFNCEIPSYNPITYINQMIFSAERFEFQAKQTLIEGNTTFVDKSFVQYPPNDDGTVYQANWNTEAEKLRKALMSYVVSRWQMLDEGFMPQMQAMPTQIGNMYLLDRCAHNLVFTLDFMQKTRPDLYAKLQYDLQFLLEHVDHIQTERNEHEAQLFVHEIANPNIQAPTVSSGTARIMAMLTAYYALDILNTSQPGLVVIEEPDTALNPGILKNYVELLREYVDRPEPRQFILTTHNPTFLNYFNPEEVRIVSRDEEGYTTVDRVPDYIKDIWLDKYDLGEVWLTNAFGGMKK